MTSRAIPFILLAGTIISAPTAAQAASFSCDATETALENIICSDEDLSALDEDLAAAWEAALGGLSEAASEALLDDQREWLTFTDGLCIDNGGLLRESDPVSCLKEFYRSRVLVLGMARQMGDYRFYFASRYGYNPDPYAEPDSRVQYGFEEAIYPLIDGEDPAAQAFNAIVAETAEVRSPLLSEGHADGSQEYSTHFTVEQALPLRITVSDSGYMYGHGAAHGNGWQHYLHYLPNEQRLLQSEDIFAGDEWQGALSAIVDERLRADNIIYGYDYPSEYAVANPESWLLGEDALTIQFQLYEVAPYVAGMPTVEIEWTLLEPYLADTAWRIIEGY